MNLTDEQYTNLVRRLEDRELAVDIFLQGGPTGTERAIQRAGTLGFLNGLMDGLITLDVDASDIYRVSPHMLDVVNSLRLAK